ncbi:YfaZ precursor [Fontimonas thermophila]|uniref:YfaZ n=1 Tax=Fontimonas thermophila TaxID=1076937 RepID=A0A1I2HUC4_9GAMM|nr:YfaZ family outer membrane protein [Fontimonas thermophila]SFF32031.1 YfaZ precursor [Fontimonas thermophila]
MTKILGMLGVSALMLATAAHAEIIDVSVGDGSVRGALYGPLSRAFEGTKGQYDVGVIVRPERDDDLLVTHVGALVTGDAGAQQFELAAGLGLRGVYVGRDHDSGGALALGGQAEARYPGYERFGLSVYGYYAPEVLSFGEFDQYYEIGTGLDYQVIRSASVYIGYRNVNLRLENGGDITADNGLHVGMRLSF